MDDAALRQIQEIAEKSYARFMADYEAQRRKAEPTAEQKQAQSLNEAQFRNLVTEHALLHGVNPKSVRFVTREAEAVFECRDGALVPKHGAVDPGDPCSALSVARWLTALRETEPYLFAAPGREH